MNGATKVLMLVVVAIASILIAAFAGPFFNATAVSPQLSNSTSSHNVKVLVSEGLPRSAVFPAFTDYSIRESEGLQSLQVFSKAGGSLASGESSPNLRVDFPIPANQSDNQLAFQYFVPIQEQLTANLYHCSDVRLHVYIGEKQVYVTNWLGYQNRSPMLPLETGKITINGISGGKHELGLIPEGRVSGCNIQGYVLSWGGLVAIFNSTPQSMPASMPSSGQLRGWWKFDDGSNATRVLDSSNYSNTATLQGTAYETSIGCANSSGCLTLDGREAYANITASPSLAVSNVTVSAWFSTNHIHGPGSIFNIRNSSNIGGITLEPDGIYADTLKFFAFIDGQWQVVSTPYTGYTDGQWHNIVGTFDGTYLSIYLDGHLKNRISAPGTITKPISPAIEIGRNIVDYRYLFDGKIDDVRVYDYALTPQQIYSIYANH